MKIGDPEFQRLQREWYAKAAACPCKPRCPRGKCPEAVSLNDDVFMGGGSGGADPNHRDVSFQQLDAIDPLTGGSIADRLMTESEAIYGSPTIAATPENRLWMKFSQAVAGLPLNYRGHRVLVALADTGFIAEAARRAGVSYKAALCALARFCREHGIDRDRLLKRLS